MRVAPGATTSLVRGKTPYQLSCCSFRARCSFYTTLSPEMHSVGSLSPGPSLLPPLIVANRLCSPGDWRFLVLYYINSMCFAHCADTVAPPLRRRARAACMHSRLHLRSFGVSNKRLPADCSGPTRAGRIALWALTSATSAMATTRKPNVAVHVGRSLRCSQHYDPAFCRVLTRVPQAVHLWYSSEQKQSR
jgi:hypothetical protein